MWKHWGFNGLWSGQFGNVWRGALGSTWLHRRGHWLREIWIDGNRWFVRFTSLDRQQRSHMFTQERANLVIWNLRNRAETTDTQDSNLPQAGEDAEEEGQTEDPLVEPNVHSPGQIEALLENMWRDQNVALSNERWMDASQIQSEISTLIDATAGGGTRHPQCLPAVFRTHRNRGSDERMERFRVYVENIASLMTWGKSLVGSDDLSSQKRWKIRQRLNGELCSTSKGGVQKTVDPTHSLELHGWHSTNREEFMRNLHIAVTWISCGMYLPWGPFRHKTESAEFCPLLRSFTNKRWKWASVCKDHFLI